MYRVPIFKFVPAPLKDGKFDHCPGRPKVLLHHCVDDCSAFFDCIVRLWYTVAIGGGGNWRYTTVPPWYQIPTILVPWRSRNFLLRYSVVIHRFVSVWWALFYIAVVSSALLEFPASCIFGHRKYALNIYQLLFVCWLTYLISGNRYYSVLYTALLIRHYMLKRGGNFWYCHPHITPAAESGWDMETVS